MKRFLAFVFAFLLLLYPAVLAHSGGTDANTGAMIALSVAAVPIGAITLAAVCDCVIKITLIQFLY